jgi:hypothetical protein
VVLCGPREKKSRRTICDFFPKAESNLTRGGFLTFKQFVVADLIESAIGAGYAGDLSCRGKVMAAPADHPAEPAGRPRGIREMLNHGSYITSRSSSPMT